MQLIYYDKYNLKALNYKFIILFLFKKRIYKYTKHI